MNVRAGSYLYRTAFATVLAVSLALGHSGCGESEPEPLSLRMPAPDIEQMTDEELALWEAYYETLTRGDIEASNGMIEVPQGGLKLYVVHFESDGDQVRVAIELENRSDHTLMIPEQDANIAENEILVLPEVTKPRYINRIPPGERITRIFSIPLDEDEESAARDLETVILSGSRIRIWRSDRLTIRSGPITAAPLYPGAWDED